MLFDQSQELPHLIWLRLPSHVLKVQEHLWAVMDIDVVTTASPVQPKTYTLREHTYLKKLETAGLPERLLMKAPDPFPVSHAICSRFRVVGHFAIDPSLRSG